MLGLTVVAVVARIVAAPRSGARPPPRKGGAQTPRPRRRLAADYLTHHHPATLTGVPKRRLEVACFREDGRTRGPRQRPCCRRSERTRTRQRTGRDTDIGGCQQLSATFDCRSVRAVLRGCLRLRPEPSIGASDTRIASDWTPLMSGQRLAPDWRMECPGAVILPGGITDVIADRLDPKSLPPNSASPATSACQLETLCPIQPHLPARGWVTSTESACL